MSTAQLPKTPVPSQRIARGWSQQQLGRPSRLVPRRRQRHRSRPAGPVRDGRPGLGRALDCTVETACSQRTSMPPPAIDWAFQPANRRPATGRPAWAAGCWLTPSKTTRLSLTGTTACLRQASRSTWRRSGRADAGRRRLRSGGGAVGGRVCTAVSVSHDRAARSSRDALELLAAGKGTRRRHPPGPRGRASENARVARAAAGRGRAAGAGGALGRRLGRQPASERRDDRRIAQVARPLGRPRGRFGRAPVPG